MRNSWVRAVAAGYPLLMVAVTLLTHNHVCVGAVVSLARRRRVAAASSREVVRNAA